MLNLDRLRVLHAVATAGSVVGAARSLRVTTSAVSQQLGRLEHEVGQQLAERYGRGIRLTEVGTLLANRAADLLDHVEQVEAGLAEHRGEVTGTITIAAFATAIRGLLPGPLCELRSAYQDLSVTVTEREPHEAIPALNQGHCDIAVVQDWAERPLTLRAGLSSRHLVDDAFELAVPADHRLADRDRVRISELDAEDWITWRAGEICHDWLLGTLRANGVRPRAWHTASEHSTQLALVAAGLGASVIPCLGREPAAPSVRFVPLDPTPTRRVLACWRTGTTARPAVRATLNALRAHAGSLAGRPATAEAKS